MLSHEGLSHCRTTAGKGINTHITGSCLSASDLSCSKGHAPRCTVLTLSLILRVLQVLAALKRAGVHPEDVSAMVADNAANQKRAGDLAVFDSLGCVAHTLQLTAKRCMETPRSARALRNWRKVCSSFRHSGLKLEDLYKWQAESGLKVLKPIQDLPTRWYYSYLSTNYALENKVPLKMAFAKYGDPNPPLPAQRAVTRQSSGACPGQKEALTAKASEEFCFTSDEDCSSSDDGSVLQLGDDELATESPEASSAKQTAASTPKPIDVSGDDPNERLSSGSELEYGSSAAGTHNKRKKAAKKKGTSPICRVLLPRCCCQSITAHACANSCCSSSCRQGQAI